MNKKIKYLLMNFELVLACAFLVGTTVCVLINVFARYILKIGISWSEEMSTAFFVWSVFLGSASAYRYHKHIGVDMVVKKFPAGVQSVIQIIVDVILIVLNGYLFYLSIVYISQSYIKPTATLGISSAYVSASLVACFCLCSVYSVWDLIKDLKTIMSGGNIRPGEEVEK